MKTSTLAGMITGGLCAMAMVAGLAMGRNVGAQVTQGALKISVVNLAKAVKNCAALDELTARTRDALERDFGDLLKGLNDDLKAEEDRFDELRRASDTSDSILEAARAAIETAKANVKLAEEARDSTRQVMTFQNTLEVMALANLAIRDVAIRSGSHIVFKTIDLKGIAAEGQGANTGLAQLQAFRQNVEGNMVLYYNGPSPSGEMGRIQDITDDVNDLLKTWKYNDKRDAIRREMGVDKLRDE